MHEHTMGREEAERKEERESYTGSMPSVELDLTSLRSLLEAKSRVMCLTN